MNTTVPSARTARFMVSPPSFESSNWREATQIPMRLSKRLTSQTRQQFDCVVVLDSSQFLRREHSRRLQILDVLVCSGAEWKVRAEENLGQRDELAKRS